MAKINQFVPEKKNTFDQVAYLIQKVQPIKKILEEQFQKHHNQYLAKIYHIKINCYNEYEHSSSKNVARDYYSCLKKVDSMVDNNFSKINNEAKIVNIQFNNCIEDCSNRSFKDEEFLQCAEKSQKSCVNRYKNIVVRMYRNMYKQILVQDN